MALAPELIGALGIAATCGSLFALGSNEAAVLAGIGPPGLSVPIVSLFLFFGILITGGSFSNPIYELEFTLFRENFDEASGALALVSVLVSAFLVMSLGTLSRVPVATLHAVVGGMVGVMYLAEGWKGVGWNSVVAVAVSWVLSPFLGGIFALSARYVLRLAGFSHARYKLAIPLLSGFTACVTLGLVAISAPHWLIRKWLPGRLLAIAAYCLIFGTVAVATALYLRHNAGSSIASVVVYNLADDEESEFGNDDRFSPRGKDRVREAGSPHIDVTGPTDTVVMDVDLSGEAGDGEFSSDEEYWTAGVFVLDERAPIFQLLLVSTMAGISFACGCADIGLILAPLTGIWRFYRAASPSVRAVAQDAGIDDVAVPSNTDIRLGLWVISLSGLVVVAGLVLLGKRVMWTLGQVNKRIKLSYARSFSVYLAAIMAILSSKWMGLPVSMSYCVVASHAVSSVAYIPTTERALERVHEGLDVRLLSKMAGIAAIAPGLAAILAVCFRFAFGVILS